MTRAPFSIALCDVLAAARARRASDVHLEAGIPPVLRVDGALEALEQPPMRAQDVAEFVATHLSDRERSRLAADGDVTATWIEADRGSMRVHVYRGVNGAAIAIRLLDPDVPSLDSLGMPPATAALADRDRGLIVFGGATGCGKSTTMAALVDRINATSARRIVTVEDPIEYRYRNRRSIVTQREVGRDTPALASALHGALRADPDVLVVGEMRDCEAMRVALTAAETGHLVLTTVHAGNAAQIVDRFVDVFPADEATHVRASLAAVLIAAVYQRLVRRAGGLGRRAAVEMLIGTDAVRSLIREGKVHQLPNAIATGRAVGMQTLEQHLQDLVRRGEIDAPCAAGRA